MSTVRPKDNDKEEEEKNFGRDIGLVHQTVVTGRKLKVPRSFYARLAEHPTHFARVLDFAERDFQNSSEYQPEAVFHDPEYLFYQQAMRLVALGYHWGFSCSPDRFMKELILPLRDQLLHPEVLERLPWQSGKGGLQTLPFIIVVPDNFASLEHQAGSISHEGLRGYVDYEGKDVYRRPAAIPYRTPYLLINVDTSISRTQFHAKWPEDERLGHCLTATEGLAVALHIPIFGKAPWQEQESQLPLRFLGSRWSEQGTPTLDLEEVSEELPIYRPCLYDDEDDFSGWIHDSTPDHLARRPCGRIPICHERIGIK